MTTTSKFSKNTKTYKNEIWKKVSGLEKYIEVSNYGRVKSLARKYLTGKYLLPRDKGDKILSPRIVRNYFYTMLDIRDGDFKYRKNKSNHRLVAETFIPNDKNLPQVNHKDGNKLNNHLSNLEWVTKSENIIHAISLGLIKKPKGSVKFSSKEVKEVFVLRRKGLLHKEIAKELGMGVSTVTHILLRSRRSEEYKSIEE